MPGLLRGMAHAQHLLELELDRRPGLVHLALDRLVLGDEGGELAGLVEAGAEQAGDLPANTFNGTQDDWEKLSPGMRREIARSAKRAAP